jgi:hypothetical protein
MKRLIITEEEKKHILGLHQNLKIKDILQEELEGNIYTTENAHKLYYGKYTDILKNWNTQVQGKSEDEVVVFRKGIKFTRVPGGATAFDYDLKFKCSRVGTVKFDNGGTGNKHFIYNKKTYWANALQKKLISVFCGSSSNSNNKGCLKGNCQNGYGEFSYGSGAIYKGQFKNGNFSGKGTLTIPSGININHKGMNYPEGTYSGTWVEGKMNGTGKVTETDGTIKYYGNLKDSKYDGKGKYGYGDGSYLWGEWNMDNTTDQTYYKNTKGCFFKGKGGQQFILSGKGVGEMDSMECTPGQWIDLENPQTPVGSNPDNPSGEVGNPSNEVKDPSGNIISGCTQYNDCSSKDGSTTKFVKCDTCSEISRLQACLKDANGNMLKADSKWGKNTEEALNLLNYNGTDGITSEIITTICTNFNQPQS